MASNSDRLSCFDHVSDRTVTIRGNPTPASAPLLGPQRSCVKLFSG